MPANFTRRSDLFLDAGFRDGDGLVEVVAAEVAALGLPEAWVRTRPGDGGGDEIRSALAPRIGRVPSEQLRLAGLVPEWLTDRTGDLATVLWLVRAEHGGQLDLPGFLLAVLDRFVADGKLREAAAFGRFMFDLTFDWGRLYADPAIAHAFLAEREPNPLVWKLLEELHPHAPLRVVELGCGIGNDAFGLLGSPDVASYVGIDFVPEALEHFERRVAAKRPRVTPSLRAGDFLDVLGEHPDELRDTNLAYSYSSLHYFSSGELKRIYTLVHRLLLGVFARPGFFAFGIKGAGSLWDGQGLPLYRPDVWINWDGQSRWFPSKKALATQLDRSGFEIRFHEEHDHWGYSERGRRDVFHYVLCSPRAFFLGEGI